MKGSICLKFSAILLEVLQGTVDNYIFLLKQAHTQIRGRTKRKKMSLSLASLVRYDTVMQQYVTLFLKSIE